MFTAILYTVFEYAEFRTMSLRYEDEKRKKGLGKSKETEGKEGKIK